MIAVITIFQVERNGFGDKIVKRSAKNAVFFKKTSYWLADSREPKWHNFRVFNNKNG